MSLPNAVPMSAPDDPGDPPPLSRYSRTEKTTADIRHLKFCDPKALADAFAESDENAAGYRSAEALIYFILAAIERGDTRCVETLFKHLRARCLAYMRSWVRGVANDEDRLEIQSRVFEQMTRRIVQGGPSCDFLQARFWRYLKLRTLSAIGEFKTLRSKERLLDDLTAGDDSDNDSRIDQIRAGALSPEDRLLIADALQALPPDLRETYVLRHYAGWRVGDERKDDADPNDPTLMEYFGLSRRAIDKRLAKAESLLERYRKDPA